MGNWRTVMITGTVPTEQVKPLCDALLYDFMSDDPAEHEKYGPLAFSPRGGLCGLGQWPQATVEAAGNCFERDFGVDDIADHLRKLLAAAPGMALKVHCGDDWESDTCIATVTVQDGTVTVGDPEVPTVSGVSQSESMVRLFGFLTRP